MDFANLNADVNLWLTKHYTPGRVAIQQVIWHYNAGDLTVEGCYSVWQTRPASAHYQVESSGRIGQLVHDRDTAWAVGNWYWNQRTISIEVANQGDSVTDSAIESLAHLTAALCRVYGLGRPEWGRNVRGHSDISATSCPGPLKAGRTYHDRALARAQEWYDAMGSGSQPVVPAPSQPAPQPAPQPSGLEVDGWWGEATTRRAQQLAGTYVDGVISGQYAPDRWRHKGCPSFRYGRGGSTFIRWLQANVLHVAADGYFGPASINAFISRYYSGPDGKIDGPSGSVKGFQRALNEGHF